MAEPFVISRGTKTHAAVIVVEAMQGGSIGRGESVPYARYGETCARVQTQIASASRALAGDSRASTSQLRSSLQNAMPGGAARNALDCALWDLEARQSARSAADMAGTASFQPTLTAYTLSLDSPEAMAAKARAIGHLPLLKLKLGGGDADRARMRAVRAARPDARLIADANEAWTDDALPELLDVAAQTAMETIEQPLPADRDQALARIHRPVPVCADESVHTRAGLKDLALRYDAINIKLDKTGGLTEALLLAAEARALGLEIMVGSMVATSLSMAPALLLCGSARWVDLDGPLLLAKDRAPGLAIVDGTIQVPPPGLWG